MSLDKRILLRCYELIAALTGKSFYCRALKGESRYNICINSDLSVSCNCNDFDGSGKIGSIEKQSLQEILSGKKASFLRKSLAKGKIPLLSCVNCTDFYWTGKKKETMDLTLFKTPAGIMVENTANCNLNCLSCRRRDVIKNRRKMQMSLKDVRKVSQLIKENHIESIAFFNLGEPFFSKKIKEELSIIRELNPDIEIFTTTNGTLLDTPDKREAAMFFDLIQFSIDGINQKTLSRYQKNGDFEKSFSNMRALVEFKKSQKRSKPVIEWKYVLFRWNDHPKMIATALTLAKDSGIDKISFWPTFSPRYGISYKYFLGFNYLKKLGHLKGNRIEVNLANDSENE